MFGRRRKSTKKLEPFSALSAPDAVALRAQLLPTDAQVEEDVRTAPTDDVAFTAQVPTLDQVLGEETVSIRSRFESGCDDDDELSSSEATEEQEEEEDTAETGSDIAPERIKANQDDAFVTKALEHNLNLHKLSNLRATLSAGTIDLHDAQNTLNNAINDFQDLYTELGDKFEETRAVKAFKKQ